MRLSNLLTRVDALSLTGPTDPDVGGVHFDSRKVGEGYLFVAVPGTQVDGHIYIDRVIAAGASVVVCERLPETLSSVVTYVVVPNASYALGILANAWYGNPSEQLTLVGVTGTNGKTTTATLLYRLFNRLGFRAGLLSTICNYAGDEVVPSTHTTGDALQIASLMSKMVESGCSYCFMEVTSHAIHQNRISGLHFNGAVFTNLSHDHLDYHGTMEAYCDVKKSYFDHLPADAFALYNADDPVADYMSEDTNAKVHTYGCTNGTDFPLEILSADAVGMKLKIGGFNVPTRLVGTFNASNLAAVFGAGVLLGLDSGTIARDLSTLDPVEGRMERIDGPAGITAVVDFAHTPDALEKVLATLRKSASDRKLICVVGCGGDRDHDKRPLMAQIAARGSDQVIFTSDNPRSEDPEAILDEMMAGVNSDLKGRVKVIKDRGAAIATACRDAPEGSIIIIAGKGHEKFQEIGGAKLPFDDVKCAQQAFLERAD